MPKLGFLGRLLGNDSKWMYFALPANIAYGPVSVLISLYILELGGNVIDVAYAITLGSAIAIPSALFWGELTDSLDRRKAFMIISYLGLFLSLFGIFMIRSVIGVTLIYGAISFIITASAAPVSLLVMEKVEKSKWSDSFVKLQILSSGGAAVGFVISYFTTYFLPLRYLTLVLMAFSLSAVLLVVAFVFEAKKTVDRHSIFENVYAFIFRTVALRLVFVKIPSRESMMKAVKFMFGEGGKPNPVALFYFLAFFFYMGTGLFNTVYPVGLAHYFNSSSIFLLLFIGLLVQALSFYYYNKIKDASPEIGVVRYSLMARGLGYAGISAAFLFAAGGMLYGVNVVFYLISAGFAYSLYFVSSNVIFFKILGSKNRGGKLGIYSGLSGLGTVAGAILSGYASRLIGYWFTFAAAGAIMVVCYVAFSLVWYDDGADALRLGRGGAVKTA